jgi:hypothetical protein
MFLPKFLGGGGGQGFQEKFPGGSTYFVFYCNFINKFFENLPGGGAVSLGRGGAAGGRGGCCFIPPPPPPPYPPPCVHLCLEGFAWA